MAPKRTERGKQYCIFLQMKYITAKIFPQNTRLCQAHIWQTCKNCSAGGGF